MQKTSKRLFVKTLWRLRFLFRSLFPFCFYYFFRVINDLRGCEYGWCKPVFQQLPTLKSRLLSPTLSVRSVETWKPLIRMQHSAGKRRWKQCQQPCYDHLHPTEWREVSSLFASVDDPIRRLRLLFTAEAPAWISEGPIGNSYLSWHVRGKGKGKDIAVCETSPTPLREITYHIGSHSVTCHPAEVTFPPLPQPKLYSI